MTGRLASVLFGDRTVGALRENEQGRLELTYDREWARSGFPISVSLPITGDARAQDAHAFFAGLLPEAGPRRRICRQLRLSEDDDVGLLFAIGQDCAGALSVVEGSARETRSPEVASGATQPRPLDADDFARIVESGGQALPAGVDRQRFSLAGAQDKVAVCLEGDTLWLPTRSRASTHILKFETIKRVCLAEYAAHDMARRLGLSVAATEYFEYGEPPVTPYLRIRRYDRVRDDDGKVQRLHQEDMAQALCTTEKYESEGGPNLGRVAELLRRVCESPVEDIQRLRDWQLFNYLVGNADAHAKNLALLYPTAGSVPRLSPAYDLVAIEFLNRLGMRFNRSMAFAIGEHDVPEQVTRRDWTLLAKSIGVPGPSLLGRLQEMAETLPDLARDTRRAFAARFGDNPAYDRLEESIRDRCAWTLQSVFGR